MRELRRILIVRLGALGDIIHAIPAAAALRSRYPDARIHWMVDPRYVELLGLVEAIDEPIAIDPRALLDSAQRRAFIGRMLALREARYDVVIDFQGLLKSAVLARAVRGDRTIGFPGAHLREPAARFFYTDTPDPGDAVHVIRKNLALLRSLGVTDSQIHFPIRVPRTWAVESVASRYGAGGYALINPGAAWPNKRWPAERFGALAEAIRRDLGVPSLVLWGPGEEALAAEVIAASSGAAVLSPPTAIVDVPGLARDARVFVSGDTGPLHMAGAVGTPLVSLFGPTYPERNGPWSEADITLSRVQACECRYERQCRRSARCIDDISVDEVADAVRRRVGPRV